MTELRTTLAQLRQDPRDWRQGQDALSQAVRNWQADPAVAAMLRALDHFGQGVALDRCAALAALFQSGESVAERMTRSLIGTVVAALEAHPLGLVPLPHGSRDAVPTLILASAGDATLALSLYDREALSTLPAPRTVRFQPVESWMRVLVGTADGEHILRRDRSPGGPVVQTVIHSGRVTLGRGDIVYRYGPREALQVRRVHESMAVLRLERSLRDVGPVREHSLPDGALLRQTSASRDESRSELAIALLGQMQRQDAVPALSRIVLHEGGPASVALRWQALREAVALDARTGMELLSHIAAVPEDSLSTPAAAWRAALARGRQWPG